MQADFEKKYDKLVSLLLELTLVSSGTSSDVEMFMELSRIV